MDITHIPHLHLNLGLLSPCFFFLLLFINVFFCNFCKVSPAHPVFSLPSVASVEYYGGRRGMDVDCSDGAVVNGLGNLNRCSCVQ